MKRFLASLLAVLVLITPAYAAGNRVVVSKQDLVLSVISLKGDTLLRVPCCVGLNKGQKTMKGDMKTPEGTFQVSQIQNSRKWTHDFGDGAGSRKGAYGPWFIRLKVPGVTGIGIHGTCFPESMSTRGSEGCIRLLNSDLQQLVKLIGLNTEVTILPD